MLGLFRNPFILNSIKYLTFDMRPNGAYINAEDEYLNVVVLDENPYIESGSLIPEIFDGANSIKMKIYNNSNCTAVTYYYTTTRYNSFSPERSSVLPIEKITSGDNTPMPQVFYFPLPSTPIDQIRIVFNGATEGDIQISSITPSSSYVPTATGHGSVDECYITSDASAIIVTGTLTDAAYEEYRNMRLELYALEINESDEDINNANVTPLANVRTDRSFSFSVPYIPRNNSSAPVNVNLLCSKFIVAAVDTINNTKIIIDSANYITNPEVLSKSKTVLPKPLTKKGMIAPTYSESQLLGINSTSVNIYLSKLLSIETTPYEYSSDGFTYYFSRNYVETLDAKLAEYAKSNQCVTAVVSLTLSSDEVINRILIHPDADRSRYTAEFAFNTITSEGIRYLKAIFGFLAERYSSDVTEYGKITNYVVGNKVNNAYVNYYMGQKSLGDFVITYAAAVRIAFNTLRSINNSIAVFISLDSNWDNNLPADSLLKYDGRSFLDTFTAYVKEFGDINWNLAYDTFPNYYIGIYTPWDDDNAVNSFNTPVITMKNIDLLCKYLTRQPMLYLYNATQRSVIILEQGSVVPPSSTTEIDLLNANYVYSYYKINSGDTACIESYIPSLILSSDFVKYIDTPESEKYTEFAKYIIGIDNWSDRIYGFDLSKIVKYYVMETAISPKAPLDFTGSYKMWRFDTSDDSAASTDNLWLPDINCRETEANVQLADKHPLLKIQLDNVSNSLNTAVQYRGISSNFEYPLDLSCAPVISFQAQISMLSGKVSKCKLSVILLSGDSYILSSGVIEEGVWNDIYIDLKDFPKLTSIDSFKIWISNDEGSSDVGEPILFITDITINSTEFDTDYITSNIENQRLKHMPSVSTTLNMQFIWILTAVIIMASTLLIIHILTKRKFTEEDGGL
jgi:hypothetical protein